jgi:hypothetical protein
MPSLTTTALPDDGRPDEPARWRWILDQRGEQDHARPPAVLGTSVRQDLEPIRLVRPRPAVHLDAAPRRSLDADADARAGSGADEAGQATAEYALVLLGAAAIALLVVSWATKTNVVGKLLDVIFSQLIGHATGGGH